MTISQATSLVLGVSMHTYAEDRGGILRLRGPRSTKAEAGFPARFGRGRSGLVFYPTEVSTFYRRPRPSHGLGIWRRAACPGSILFLWSACLALH